MTILHRHPEIAGAIGAAGSAVVVDGTDHADVAVGHSHNEVASSRRVTALILSRQVQ